MRSTAVIFVVISLYLVVTAYYLALKAEHTLGVKKPLMLWSNSSLDDQLALITCKTVEQATSSGQWIKQNKTWQPHSCVLPKTDTPMINYPLSKLVLMGDSNTFKLHKNLREQFQCGGRVLNFGGRCSLGKYLKVDNSLKWQPPNVRREGPLAHGRKHPRCNDCSGCNPSWRVCKNVGKMSLEYIPVEFSRDVIVQSKKYATTQENVVDYLNRTEPPTAIVFNSGAHDLAYSNVSAYIENLLWYTQLLKTNFPDAKILFINTACVVESEVPPQHRNYTRNDFLAQHNAEAKKIMKSLNVAYLDNFRMSNNSFAYQNYRLAHDPIHLTPEFYNKLIEMLHVQLELWFRV